MITKPVGRREEKIKRSETWKKMYGIRKGRKAKEWDSTRKSHIDEEKWQNSNFRIEVKKKVANLSSLLVGYVVPLNINKSFILQENNEKGNIIMS